jgi:hypothetical protein
MDSPKYIYSNKQPKTVQIIDRMNNPISAAKNNQTQAFLSQRYSKINPDILNS